VYGQRADISEHVLFDGSPDDFAPPFTWHFAPFTVITPAPACAILKFLNGGSMIDPVQLPILMKAIDFVFDEGRKILDERRERRKMGGSSPESEEPQEAKEIVALEPEKAHEIKQDLIASKIDDLLWQDQQWYVEKLVSTLEKQTKSYYILKEQYAQFGSALVPAYIVLAMEEKENAIIETRRQLEAILSKVYKKDINPNK
jgi:hypothetical protein